MSDPSKDAGKSAAPAKRRVTALSVVVIQAAVIVYTGSNICSKMTSNYPAFSGYWILWVFLELCCLGAYALFWQQIIKRFDLSVAYANRAFAIFWSMLWAFLIFSERVTLKNLFGVVVIFFGILLVNIDAR